MRKNRFDDLDDGRVIASMNVEGMPWYTPKPSAERASGRATEQSVRGPGAGTDAGTGAPEKMTRQESVAFACGVLKAVLLVAFALIGGYFAFIWFCVNIWFS